MAQVAVLDDGPVDGPVDRRVDQDRVVAAAGRPSRHLEAVQGRGTCDLEGGLSGRDVADPPVVHRGRRVQVEFVELVEQGEVEVDRLRAALALEHRGELAVGDGDAAGAEHGQGVARVPAVVDVALLARGQGDSEPAREQPEPVSRRVVDRLADHRVLTQVADAAGGAVQI